MNDDGWMARLEQRLNEHTQEQARSDIELARSIGRFEAHLEQMDRNIDDLRSRLADLQYFHMRESRGAGRDSRAREDHQG